MTSEAKNTKSYSAEEVEAIKTAYVANPTRETIEALAEQFNRTVRSVVSKLSREGVYTRQPYRTKLGEVPHTKDDIVDLIAEILGEYPEALDGLEKCPKMVLRKIAEALEPGCMQKFKG